MKSKHHHKQITRLISILLCYPVLCSTKLIITEGTFHLKTISKPIKYSHITLEKSKTGSKTHKIIVRIYKDDEFPSEYHQLDMSFESESTKGKIQFSSSSLTIESNLREINRFDDKKYIKNAQIDYQESENGSLALKLTHSDINLEILGSSDQSEYSFGRLFSLIMLIVICIAQFFVKMASFTNFAQFNKDPIRKLHKFPILGTLFQLTLSIYLFGRMVMYFEGKHFFPYLFLAELPSIYTIGRYFKYTFGFFDKKLPQFAIVMNGLIFTLISFYPKFLPFCMINIIASYALDQFRRPQNNFFAKSLKNTFGLITTIFYGWFYTFNWSLWQTDWIIGIIWASTIVIFYILLYTVYKNKLKFDWRYSIAARLKKAKKESMITRATLVLLKKHPEIREQLILQRKMLEKHQDLPKEKQQIKSRNDVSSLGSILALNHLKRR